MFRKLIAIAARPRNPAKKVDVLRLLRWQLLLVGIAFVFAILDLLNVIPLRANALMPFIFLPLGITAAAYLDIKEAGLQGDDANDESNESVSS